MGDAHGTPAQIALRFVLANPGVDCVDIGPGEITHLEDAAQAAAAGPLSAEALADLDRLYASGFSTN